MGYPQGSRIDRYEIIDELGEGACAVRLMDFGTALPEGARRLTWRSSRAEEVGGGYDPVGDALRVEPLPRSLDDALDEQLRARLVDGRRAEAQAHGALVTDWERARYLDGA